MPECRNCRNGIKDGDLYECPTCGMTVCGTCADKTFKICPHCYSNLEIRG